MVSCTSSGKAPAGTWTVTCAPSTVTGPTTPPAGVMVTVVTSAVNPPGGAGVVTGGGGDCLPAVDAPATPAVPHASAAPSMIITNSLIATTLCSRNWTCRFRCAGMNPPFSSRTGGQPAGGANAVSRLTDGFVLRGERAYPSHNVTDRSRMRNGRSHGKLATLLMFLSVFAGNARAGRYGPTSADTGGQGGRR